ncbi:MAG: hypothetical protein WBW48_08135 [Anaerolineae bacterium]
MKALSFVPIVVLLGAVLLGFTLSQTDILNQHTRTAEARRMDVETDALADQYKFDQELRQIELKRIQEETTINLEALRARRAKELELMNRGAQLKSRLFELAAMISLGVFVVLGGAEAFRLFCAGFALLRQEKQAAAGVTQENRRVVPFPGLLQRTRVPAKNSTTALALLVLGAAILTASVTLL